MRARLVAIGVALAMVLSGLVVGVAGPATPVGAAGGGVVDLGSAVPATFTVTPGVEQVTVTGAVPRTPLTLVDGSSLERILTLYTDDLGQLTYRYVPEDFLVFDPQTQGVMPTTEGRSLRPGTYRLVSEGVPGEPFEGTVEASDPFDVLGVDDVPDPALYEQELPFVWSSVDGGVQPGSTDEDGFGYLETRDGTTLSVNVRLPDPSLYGPGPYPTVVQYSGYAPSRPGLPSGADAGGMLAGVLGFAYVGVNVRGSGCSGGVFDVFNGAQAADGYDIVETVARQPWVKHGKVGMMGISYSGITQLYTAATNPPSLAAITPLSVIEDPWDQQWPGGIYNAGFTQQWLAQRDDEANGGATWVKDRIANGDETCEANLDIRSQNMPFEDFARSLERRPADADHRNLSAKVREIDVPVFLTGAWQDEQTGARFANLLDDFDAIRPGAAKFTVFNGHHPDGLSPLIMSRWFEFLTFYVDGSVPQVPALVRAGAGPVFESIFGVPGLSFEPDRFRDPETGTPIHGDLAASIAAYEAELPVRVLFEVGASPDFPTNPMAHRQRFEMDFPSWPPPAAEARTFFLGPDGTLGDAAPGQLSVDRFAMEPEVLDERYYVSGDHGADEVINDWKVTAFGKGLAYETEPLDDQVVVAGDGHLDLWFRSTAPDAPIEVVLSEVYADPDPDDGVPAEEVRVQHGLVRAGYRTVDDARSDEVRKELSYFADDYEPLVPGQFVHVTVPLFAVAHPFRAGSRLRIEINTPGRDSALWDFEFDDVGPADHDVAMGGAMASSLVLSVLPDDEPTLRIPDAFDDQAMHPGCDWLRGQPCRDHDPLPNVTVHATPACDAGRFTDVDEGNPFCTDITWLSDEAVTGGYEDDTFRPTSGVSRQAMAAFLYRMAGSPDGEEPVCEVAPFGDVGVDHPFCGEIAWLTDSGVADGFEDGTFRPAAGVSRQSMAAFLYRMAGSPDGEEPVCEVAPFGDVGVDHPFCGEIAWMAASGVANGFEDGSYRPGDPVSRQAMAAFLQRFQLLTV